MTPEELRADMPALDEVAYFNTGASAPSPRRVIDAMVEAQEHHSYVSPAEEGMYPAGRGLFDDAREAVAGLIGGDPDEVALTQSTTDGINIVAGSIDWDPGDAVVRTDVEHPAGVLPWKRGRDRHGLEVRVVENDGGYFDLDDFKEAVRGARLVVVSAVAWNYGTQLPVGEIVDIAADAGATTLVDAVQAPGQLPVDVTEWGADAVVGAGHKWLLGPWGAGFMHVGDDSLTPGRIGSGGVVDFAAEDYEYHPDARRFEVSTKSVASYAGLAGAIEAIQDVGIGTIRERIEELTDRLKAGIPTERLLSPREYETGLVSFRVEEPEAFVERLAEDGIAIRSIPYPEAVRASVHAFNTEAEVDALLAHV